MLIPRPRRSPSRRSRWLLATLTALVAAGAASCGKKGAPLPPFAKAPAAPTEVSARRQGERVEIRFTVPTADLDGQHPAHVDRIEVWALTGPVVPPPLFMKYATLVATVPVRKPPPPPPDVKEGEPPPPPPPPSTEPGLDQGQRGIAFDELTSEELLPIAIRELEKEKTREERLKLERLKDAVEPRLSPPDLGPELPPTPSRYYVVLGRNGGRKGALAARMAVPLTPLPPPPAAPIVSVAENYVEVTWTAPQGLRMPVSRGTALPSPGSLTTAAAAARAGAAAGSGVAVPPMPGTPPMPSPAGVVAPSRSDDEDVDDDDRAVPSPQPSAEPAPPASQAEAAPPASSQPAATAPVSPSENGASAAAAAGAPSEPGLLNSRSLTGFPITKTGYVIEEVPPPDYVMPVLQPGEVPPLPRRLTLTPLATTSWRDERLEYGTERCYVIRTVESTGPAAVESPPSAPTCVSPKDTFPPAAPASLAAVASEGAVSLIWEANTEADIAGYIVLRGEAPGETLAPLTPSPIKETTFRDTTAKAGVRYVYAVVAVDTATPQNVSPQSNRVEETAR